MDECYSCNRKFSAIGKHWAMSKDCDYQPLSDYQMDILTGLLMGDGWIEHGKSSSNPCIRTKMISKKYLEYLDSQFPVYGKGVNLRTTAEDNAKRSRDNGFDKNASGETYSDIYTWHTTRSPELDKLDNWYKSGEKVWPDNISLTPTVFKHWYVGDGTYQGNQIKIYMNNEVDNTDKVSKLFNDSNIPLPLKYQKDERKDGRIQCSANWSVDNSVKLFSYMGEPLSGFQYKWP